ncbi:hypothetical protein AOQ73_36365 [Bradyrhizobium pachyrhizi]|uniref:hypothetical protein n=1 Tax=Bradyrhizobium pachyrhizi TaxID=280333 RepID=UPI000704CCAC|nr:hypothetical protein [Bradyrhizobium pachyrhizi]KRP85956.1 hypothetical protein AOQ73_36365 [Bradyrhizobium pachyrhizi]
MSSRSQPENIRKRRADGGVPFHVKQFVPVEGAGIALAPQYADSALNMLLVAQFEDESVSAEAGLMDMLNRMETGKFKVFSTLLDWFEEFRLFHWKDGKVVKLGDDLLSATRYGVMMLRFAEQIYRPREPRRRRRFLLHRNAWMSSRVERSYLCAVVRLQPGAGVSGLWARLERRSRSRCQCSANPREVFQ